MNGTKSHQLKMGVCALAAAGLFVATQGCSSSSNGNTGTGGSTGATGGKTGTGGSTTGTGGAVVDAGPPLCTGVAWAGAPMITDFSDVTTPEGGTGLRVGTQGGIYTYGGTVTTLENGALHVTGTYPASTAAAQQYVGWGIYFDNCINATAYSGISFTMTGSFGTCDMLAIGASFPQDQPVSPTGHGTCTPTATVGCFGPGAPHTVTSTSVTFAAMGGGSPVATVTPEAKSRVTGVNFGFHSPLAVAGDASGDAGAAGCTVDFTVDNIAFLP